MIVIAYIFILLASLVMVYFGHAQGTSQFYMSIFSAAIIWYCVYLDYKKRQEKKEAEGKKSSTKKTEKKTTSSAKGISQIAHRSTKDKNLNEK